MPTIKKTLYHGSDAEFTEFHLDDCGKNGTALGYGVYLTSDPALAWRYTDTKGQNNAYMYTVSATLENALSSTKLTLTAKILNKILDRLDASVQLLNEFNDVAYFGKDKVKKDAIALLMQNNNDIDLFNDIAHISGNPEEVCHAFYRIGRYTHTQSDTTFVVFDPTNVDIIKRTPIPKNTAYDPTMFV